ncbi:Uncharacterised protein [Vibrio cholerae]|nr:Uncharacterised protein [Vibrio cholerae]
MLFERFKCLWLPHYAAALFNQLINAAGNAVINQIEHFAIRVKVQTEFRFVRQIGVQIFDRRWHIKQNQTALAGTHRAKLLLLGFKQFDFDAVFLID